MKKSWIWIVIIFLLVLLCCLCSVLLGAGAIIYLINDRDGNGGWIYEDLKPTQEYIPEINKQILDSSNLKTLTDLQNSEIPQNDPRDIAGRLEGKHNIPLTITDNKKIYTIGDKDSFWVTDTDSNENFQVEANLAYITDHTYFWIEDGIDYKKNDLQALADTFEEKIYPTDREFFGSEWTPGIDNDPRLFILYTRGLGYNLAGYFSSADSIHPYIHEYSNGHEMFVLNADSVDLEEEFTYGVLAHEFQHMIHWYHDRDEESWLNEGFSELAAFLNGYYSGGFDNLYASDPDMQLNDWPNDQYATTPHYGASFLFVDYFLDRFGSEATKALVSKHDNGLDSVDRVLQELQITDPLTAEPILADDVFRDMAIALFLQDDDIEDGRYYFHNYPDAPQTSATEDFTDCSSRWQKRSVHQYGVDYIRLSCNGDYSLEFEGSTSTKILPTDFYSGDYAFWSNKGDEADMTLTREFDFADVSGPITLSYWTWYDLEEDYDYLYLEVFDDNNNWEIITTPSGSDLDLSGNSYGWAYNGRSEGWINEVVDLSKYAGQKIDIRFEYVTDGAVNGEGFLLDNISIPEIDYFTDFEHENGGWSGEGFVRIKNVLPQTYQATIIKLEENNQVEKIILNSDQTFQYEMNGDEIVLMVSGTTRFTREVAPYQIRFIK